MNFDDITRNWRPGFRKRTDVTGGEDSASVAVALDHRDSVREQGWCRVDKYDDDMTSYVSKKLADTYRVSSGLLAPKKHHFDMFNIEPYETVVRDGNILTTVGLGRLTSLLIAGGGVAFSATSTTCLGVGDTATAAAVTDTTLGSNSTNHSRYIVADSTPTRVTTTVTNDSIQVVATFTTSDANYVWNEWGLVLVTTATNSDTFAATGTSPLLFNHLAPAALGTKTTGSWALTVKVKFA